MIKYITIDVDGTLVSPIKTISKKNKEAIKKVRDLGVRVSLVSGRPFEGMVRLLEDLDLTGKGEYSVCQNGSYIFDNNKRKKVAATYQYAKDLLKVEDLIKDFNLQISAMDDNDFFTRYDKPSIYTKIDAKINHLNLKKMAYEDFPSDKNFGRFLILGSMCEINKLIKYMPKALKEDYYAVQTAPFLIEVMNKKTNKGYALRSIADKLSIGYDEIMSIGNEKNDIPMLEATGFSVAMANSVDQLKDRADFITKSNLNSGVAFAIDRLIENNLEKYS